MLISDLVSTLRLDVGDTASEMLNDGYLARCIIKAARTVNLDFKTAYVVSDVEISPLTIEDEKQELILLKSHINVCVLMRSITARAFQFQSGDKQVDKTKQPGFWEALQDDLEKQYEDRKIADKAAAGEIAPDETVLITPELRPEIYEVSVYADFEYPYLGYDKERG